MTVDIDAMEDCSCPPRPSDPDEQLACPVSGTPGHAVALTTVKAMLGPSALARLTGEAYRFCPDPGCDVVYFTPGNVYRVRDVRVPVWQKQPFGERTVCYCFGENEAEIRREFEAHGASSAVERVRSHIAAGRCACEARNPRGVCCLGDVIAAVERVTASVHADAQRGILGRPTPD